MLYSVLAFVGLLSIILFILKRTAKYLPFDIIKPTEYWVWDNGLDPDKRVKIDLDDIQFPKGFLWGTATASHQIEGNSTNNNWAKWEKIGHGGSNTFKIKRGQLCGQTCDHWNRVTEDIGLMKNLGVNSYRFSVAWSKIEPKKGVFDEDVLKHYDQEIDELIANKLTPMLTLHHFEHPLWFEEAGGFEKTENIAHFVDFSVKVFNRWAPRVKFWCTINEPEVFVLGGWMQGIFPPGKKDLTLAGVVLKNVLESHVQVYHKLKNTTLGKSVQIGVVKDIFQFDPWNNLNPLDILVSRSLDSVFNESILEFLRSGKFEFQAPGAGKVTHFNESAKTSNDFVGLNYYSHYHLEFNPRAPNMFDTKHRPNVTMTDMSYPLYPEGIYRAIKRISTLKVPIYITENGIADANDTRRSLFIKQYLYAISKAIKDGFDVRGFFYWSLMDNFEWAEGFDMRFGLYEVDFKTQKRTLRDGSKALVQIIKRFS